MQTTNDSAASAARGDPARRAYWLKTLHQWHWISAAICLVAMLMFSITGITLNHASQIKATPVVTKRDGQLPQTIVEALTAEEREDKAPLPESLRAWLADELGVRAEIGEWSSDELYISLPRPGGDAWLSIELPDGEWQYERTDRGWISWLNDLHKGRNTGAVWNWFIDVFAVACIVFSVTGLFLLQLHAGRRPATWPMVGLGVLIPLILIVLFLH